MTYSEDYLEFYKAYPRHEGKADGQKAWTGLSDGDKAAALADVQKRKRMGAYSSNKRLIQLPASYLRARRWEDDWMDTVQSSRNDDLPNTGMPVVKETVAEIQLPWRERLINRCFKSYMLVSIGAGGLPDTDNAIIIKHEVLKEAEMLEDEPYPVQAETIATLFLSRMDHHYKTCFQERALKNARRAKHE